MKSLVVLDPYKSIDKYAQGNKILESLPKKNKEIIELFLYEMSRGIRTFTGRRVKERRLGDLRYAVPKFAKLIQQLYDKPINEVTKQEINEIIRRIEDGEIKNSRNEVYQNAVTERKNWNTFANWYQRYMEEEKEKIIKPIKSTYKVENKLPQFIYLNFDQVKKLATHATFEYRALIWFRFGSGIRVKEMYNIKVKNLEWDKERERFILTIPDECAKTFGRTFPLLCGSEIIKQYIEHKQLKPNDYLFTMHMANANRYLAKLAYKVLGIGEEVIYQRTHKGHKDGKRIYVKNGINMYTLRHASSCHWIPKINNDQKSMYIFGWTKHDFIHYYTRFLGIRTEINKLDTELVGAEEKTKMQKEIEALKQQIEMKDMRNEAVLKELSAQVKIALAQKFVKE